MGIGQPQPFEDALHAAILAPASVKGVENRIGAQGGQPLHQVVARIDLRDGISRLAQPDGAVPARYQRDLALR